MKKLEVIFSLDKIDSMKKICIDLELGQMTMYEVKIFNPDLVELKKYRGAEYQVEHLTKMKAEFYLEDAKAKEALDRINTEIIDTKKGDRCVTF